MFARRGFRLAALIAAVVCVLALAAGAFVLSYPGTRDIALTARVSAHLARFYPALFDAVFVVACAAAVTLRGVLRGYASLAILVIAGSVATADAVHAMSVSVPKRPLEATFAIVPWAVLLIGLTLLCAMARHALPGRKQPAAAQAAVNGKASAAERPHPTAEQPAGAAAVPLSALLADKAEQPAITSGPAAASGPATASGQTGAAGQGRPGSSGGPVAGPAAVPEPTTAAEPGTTPGPVPPPARRTPERDDPSDADAGAVDPSTHFNRLRSSPTPPGD